MSVLDVFARCNDAKLRGILIHRPSASDKEFHFQNWFADRLGDLSTISLRAWIRPLFACLSP